MERFGLTFTVKSVQTKFGDNIATNDITFICDIGLDRLHRIMGDALKVHMRTGSNRETAWKNNGKPLTVMVDDKGLTLVDPAERERLVKELTRKQYTDEMIDMNTPPERVDELRQLIREL
jgi:hypothetical protein